MIQDDTGSTTATISDKIGEELISLTAAEIYNIRYVKKQMPPLAAVDHKLLGKALITQRKKSFSKYQDTFQQNCSSWQSLKKKMLPISHHHSIQQPLQKVVHAS